MGISTISGFISPLIAKILDFILPSDQSKEIKQKKELGRYLVRISAIIDAYIHECKRLIKELSYNGELPTEMLNTLKQRLNRLTNLSYEFAATLGELSYLNLFDSQMHHWFELSIHLEMVRPFSYEMLMDTALEVSKINISEHEMQLYLVDEFCCYVKKTPLIDLFNQDDRNQLELHVIKTIETLEKAHHRLSKFVKDNFKIWELFHTRDEYNKSH